MKNDHFTPKRRAPYLLYDQLIQNKKLHHTAENILLLNPYNITNWEYHDRPENELGNIDLLATEFKKIGQIVPCIVRPMNNNINANIQYELIAGERRWRAAKKAEIKLKVIILNLTDKESALIQSSENSQRKDLSDYAKFLSYYSLIKNNILTQKDLINKLNFSKHKISRILSFKNIPLDVAKSLKDMSKISGRTSSAIVQICARGKEYRNAIMDLSSQITQGKIGHEKLVFLVNKKINDNTISTLNQVFANNDLIFTIKNKSKITIELSNKFSFLIKNKSKNEYLIKKLKNIYYELMEESQKMYPAGYIF